MVEKAKDVVMCVAIYNAMQNNDEESMMTKKSFFLFCGVETDNVKLSIGGYLSKNEKAVIIFNGSYLLYKYCTCTINTIHIQYDTAHTL